MFPTEAVYYLYSSIILWTLYANVTNCFVGVGVVKDLIHSQHLSQDGPIHQEIADPIRPHMSLQNHKTVTYHCYH